MKRVRGKLLAMRLPRRVVLCDEISSDESSSDAASPEESEAGETTEDELEGLEAFDDVDLADLCARPINEQDEVIFGLKQKEFGRYYSEWQSGDDKSSERFSQLSTESFLKKARFNSKLVECREQYVRSAYDPRLHKMRKIDAPPEQSYIFEEIAAPAAATAKPQNKPPKGSVSSSGPTVGKMRLGESIIDALSRVNREKIADMKQPLTEDVEWEDIPLKDSPLKRI